MVADLRGGGRLRGFRFCRWSGIARREECRKQGCGVVGRKAERVHAGKVPRRGVAVNAGDLAEGRRRNREACSGMVSSQAVCLAWQRQREGVMKDCLG